MTDGSKKRLGGWTRLWLVFSAVWVVGCSVVFFNTAPERESVELSSEEADQYRVDQIVQAIKSDVEGIYPLDYWIPGDLADLRQKATGGPAATEVLDEETAPNFYEKAVAALPLTAEEAATLPEDAVAFRIVDGQMIPVRNPEYVPFTPQLRTFADLRDHRSKDEQALERETRSAGAVIALAESLKINYQINPETPYLFTDYGLQVYEKLPPTPAMQDALEQKRRQFIPWFHLLKFLAVALLVPMAFFGSGWTVRWVWDGFVKKDA
jgi:hypothetical protein